ncbi:hypothetical protein GM418_27625 [Maribellus comscasis]|uniref:Uncharacterized protein n=1 Tax=Maribellus comscasis TaxID=2681766 RepID=A0A6I6K123_9BACT|nr:hypothetical protein [Maribellus comscasis]QGY47299.1 hypothetical protein GM418_27625 [Maribellus comscasis]
MNIKLKTIFTLLLVAVLGTTFCFGQRSNIYIADKPFVQEYSIKYNFTNERVTLNSVVSDRNGYIQVLSSHGLLRPKAGQFLFPGELVNDVQYRPTSDKGITDADIYKNQIIYIDDKAVLSNAWAGNLYSRHDLPNAKLFSAGQDFTFLIADEMELNLLKDSETLWEGSLNNEIQDIKYDSENDHFFILSAGEIYSFSPKNNKLELVLQNDKLTCIEVAGKKVLAGTSDGFFEFDAKSKKHISQIEKNLPWPEITTIKSVDGETWFGSTQGAFKLEKNDKFSYYASKRWLPSDNVIDISKGPENSVLILTDAGLAKICRKEMTLFDKAMFFEKQVRERHIRNGFNATVSGMTEGDVTSGSMETSDNDGLWTSMYLAGEVFRYVVTKSEDALQNIRESLDAMERLYTINEIPGFPSRSFERRGYKYHDKKWRRTEDPEWDWKSTTSSDEAIGHIFAFSAIAELVDDAQLKSKAILLIDTLMATTIKNDHYLVDWNGEPTTWGRWNPEYVNARPIMVGDRKINSSNYIGMLQTAYHFTGKEKYKKTAFGLMEKHGYLENLMRPMSEIGRAPETADDWSRMLSESWNHSDDEMYYCGYWGLYRYAFNDELKAKYKEAIVDHWEAERPEKEGLWNIMTAIVGDNDYDLEEAIWYLQEYPLDLVNWTVKNSHRKDIELIPENFREQTIKEVLPPDELRISRHNANRFDLDGGSDGRSEYSAGDIWLLPYWIGRYLGVIGEPVQK